MTADLASIAAATEKANQAWVNGDWDAGYGSLLSAQADASIYGPFGGALVSGADWRQRGPLAVQQFSAGRSRLQVLRSYASGDLAVLVTLEEQSADIAGRQNQAWSLRVTQVYRREDGEWKVVHRHADPLVGVRSLPEALALASG